jgi:aspartyl-tRNA synthetase
MMTSPHACPKDDVTEVSKYRTHTNDQLRPQHVDQHVSLSGWVHRKRDHGQLLFIDLRDHYGITQCVFTPNSEAFKAAELVRLESVIRVSGRVLARTEENVNPSLPTGQVEVVADRLDVLSPADLLPFQVAGTQDIPEEQRLRFRFLDLRREKIHANVVLRSKVISSIRRRMVDQGFLEYQTPILTSSSPEGARDYLVPSRVHPGMFYALPQAPQQFK